MLSVVSARAGAVPEQEGQAESWRKEGRVSERHVVIARCEALNFDFNRNLLGLKLDLNSSEAAYCAH